MVVTATEFKQNLGRYLELSNDEEIVITKNGRPQSFLIGRRQRMEDDLNGLRGALKRYELSQEEINADPRLARLLSR